MIRILPAAAVALATTSAHAADFSPADIDAIARTAFAEADGQGAAGISAVIDVILTRLESGKYGSTVQDVVNAKYQFEPVWKAGGWRNLPPLTSKQKRDFWTVWEARGQGILAGLVPGATHFQNPVVVARREAVGQVRKGTTHFDGMEQVAKIGGHVFYKSGSEATVKDSVTVVASDAPTAVDEPTILVPQETELVP